MCFGLYGVVGCDGEGQVEVVSCDGGWGVFPLEAVFVIVGECVHLLDEGGEVVVFMAHDNQCIID